MLFLSTFAFAEPEIIDHSESQQSNGLTSVVLEWSPSTQPDIQGYVLFIQEVLPSGVSSFINTGQYVSFGTNSMTYPAEGSGNPFLSPGKNYTFRIGAFNDTIANPQNVDEADVFASDNYTLTAPPYLTLTEDQRYVDQVTVLINWTHTELEGLTGYTVERANVSNTTLQWTTILENVNVLSTTDNITQDSYYRITALTNNPAERDLTSISKLITIGELFKDATFTLDATPESNGTVRLSWYFPNGYEYEFVESITITSSLGNRNIAGTSNISATSTGANTGYADISNLNETNNPIPFTITFNLEEGYSLSNSSSSPVLWNPVITDGSIEFDRITNTVRWIVEGINKAQNLRLQYTFNYQNFGGTPISRNTSCFSDGTNFTCQVEESEFTLPPGFELIRGNSASFLGYIYNEIYPTFQSGTIQNSSQTPNAAPMALNVSIYNTTVAGIEGPTPQLVCNYTFFDPDGDAESTSQTEFIWYIQNEGFNDFVEVLGQNQSTLMHPIFDNQDNIICSVRVHDGTNFSENFVNSTIFEYRRNTRPTLYFTNTTTTLQNPAQIGDQIIFRGDVLDEDPGIPMTVFFCRDVLNQETNYGSNSEIELGTTTNANGSVLWIFFNQSNIRVDEIGVIVQNVTNDGDPNKPFSRPIWSLYAYEVDNYGDIPSANEQLTPDFKDRMNILVPNITNKLFLEDNPIVGTGKYLAVKLCIDGGEVGVCADDTISNDSITIRVNANTTYQNRNSFLAIAQNDSHTNIDNGSYFVSDNIKITYSTGSEDNVCGTPDNLLCYGEDYDQTEYTTITCPYTVQSKNNPVQQYSAFAKDGAGFLSRVRVGEFYVNHPPVAQNVTVFKQNDTITINSTGDVKNFEDSFEPAGLTAKANESLYCNFNIFDQDNQDDWDHPESNYTLTWFFKPQGAANFTACDDFAICNTNSNPLLPYGLTSPGDVWKCEVTPRDKFVNGTTVSSQEVSITFDDADDSTRPIIDNVSDNSNSQEEAIYVGDELKINVTWRDAENSQFKIYICEGSHNETNFGASGCLNTEYYRTPMGEVVTGTPGVSNTVQVNFSVPPLLREVEHDYTVFICDDSFACSLNTSAASNSFWVESLRESISINVTNSSRDRFENDMADVTDNLFCSFSYTDPGQDNETFTEANMSYILAEEILEINWYRSVDMGPYQKMFHNITNISNTQTDIGDRWYCQLRFSNAVPQETNAKPVLIADLDLEQPDPPTLVSFNSLSSDNNRINVGDEAEFIISWDNNHTGNNVHAYICNSSGITVTGCDDRTIAWSNGTDINPLTLTYVPQNSDKERPLPTWARVCDVETYECSDIESADLYINFMPKADNVTLSKSEVAGNTEFVCDYDYQSNEPGGITDEDISGAHFRWYFLTGQGSDLVDEGFGMNTFTPNPDDVGFIYCQVRVVDDLGLQDSQYRQSNETFTTTTAQYEIFVKTYHELATKNETEILGIINTEETQITAYVYEAGTVFPTKTNNTDSFENVTQLLRQATMINNLTKGETLFWISNTTNNPANFQKGYVRFGNHEKGDLTYYEFTYVNQTPQHIFLNLTEDIEANISANTTLYIYDQDRPQGWFNLTLPLFGEAYNRFELVAGDGGYYISAQNIYADVTQPIINITHVGLMPDGPENYTLTTNISHLPLGGDVSVDFFDDYELNLSSLNITIEHNGTIQNITYGTTLQASSPSRPIVDLDYFPIINQTTNRITGIKTTLFLADNLSDGNYTMNASIRDVAGYPTNRTIEFIFNGTKPIIENATIFDNVTKNNVTLRRDEVQIEWDVLHNTSLYDVQLYRKHNVSNQTLYELVTEETTNTTTIALEIPLPLEDSCYFANITGISPFNVRSNTTQTNCINYVESRDFGIYIDSDQKLNNTLYTNEELKLNISVYEASNFTHRIENNLSALIEGPYTIELNTTDDGNYNQNISVNTSTWNNTHYLLVNATHITNGSLTQRNLSIIIDNESPSIGDFSQNLSRNLNQETTLFVEAKDNFQVRDVLLIINKTGNETEHVAVTGTPVTNSNYSRYEFIINKSDLSVGDVIPFRFIVSDYARNRNETATQELTIVSPPSSSGNGGSSGSSGGGSSSGGGGGIAPPPTQPEPPTQPQTNVFIHNITNTQRNQLIRFRTPLSDLYVTQLEFRYAQPITRATIRVNNIYQLPGIQRPEEPVYGYFRIEKIGLTNDHIGDAKIWFRVRRNNNAGLGTDNVALMRWHNNRWEVYEAEYYQQDNTYFHYSAPVDGFSYFAITRKPAPVEPEIDEPTPPEEEDSFMTKILAFLAAWWIYLLIALAILVLLIVGTTVLVHKKPKQKESFDEFVRVSFLNRVPESSIRKELERKGLNEFEINNLLAKYRPKKKINFDLVDDTILKQINALKIRHMTDKEVESDLLSRKIGEEVIQSNMHYYTAFHKLEKQVKDWVRRGYTLRQIREHLIGLNWPAVIIYDVLKKYKK